MCKIIIYHCLEQAIFLKHDLFKIIQYIRADALHSRKSGRTKGGTVCRSHGHLHWVVKNGEVGPFQIKIKGDQSRELQNGENEINTVSENYEQSTENEMEKVCSIF